MVSEYTISVENDDNSIESSWKGLDYA